MLILVSAASALVAEGACFGPYASFLLPSNGASDVSPDATVAMGVDASCAGSTPYTLTLTPDDGASVSVDIEATSTGIEWFPDLELQADTSYLLDLSFNGVTDMDVAFAVGSGPVDALSGTPVLSFVEVEFDPEAGTGLASIELDLVDSLIDMPWEIMDADGNVLLAGVGEGAQVLSLVGASGDPVCFTLTQYRVDGEEVGTSDETCTTLEGNALCGCSTTSGTPVWSLLLGLALLRRRCS